MITSGGRHFVPLPVELSLKSFRAGPCSWTRSPRRAPSVVVCAYVLLSLPFFYFLLSAIIVLKPLHL